jgi:hypothetical protein
MLAMTLHYATGWGVPTSGVIAPLAARQDGLLKEAAERVTHGVHLRQP